MGGLSTANKLVKKILTREAKIGRNQRNHVTPKFVVPKLLDAILTQLSFNASGSVKNPISMTMWTQRDNSSWGTSKLNIRYDTIIQITGLDHKNGLFTIVDGLNQDRPVKVHYDDLHRLIENKTLIANSAAKTRRRLQARLLAATMA